MTRLPVDHLPPIGLDALNEEASRLTRKDRKYVVPLDVVAQVLEHDGLLVLDIDGRRSFRYESVYFDTPDLVSYLAAAHKRRRRFKVRTRSYLDSGVCALEVKTREGRGLNEKHRRPHSIDRRASLDGDAIEFVAGFDQVAPFTAGLEPALTTRYRRTTLIEPESASRMTTDIGLEAATPAGSTLVLPWIAIVETKTDGKPCAVDHLLWRLHQRPTKVSKYCTCLAAMTPGLPANKWNRALRTHFGWTPSPAEPEAATDTRTERSPAGESRLRRPLTPLLEGAG